MVLSLMEEHGSYDNPSHSKSIPADQGGKTSASAGCSHSCCQRKSRYCRSMVFTGLRSQRSRKTFVRFSAGLAHRPRQPVCAKTNCETTCITICFTVPTRSYHRNETTAEEKTQLRTEVGAGRHIDFDRMFRRRWHLAGL